MATAQKAPKKDALTLTAYCMKTKQKNVDIQDAVISLKGGKYIASGHDDDGNKLTTILSKEKALACIEKGIATTGEGLATTKKKK